MRSLVLLSAGCAGVGYEVDSLPGPVGLVQVACVAEGPYALCDERVTFDGAVGGCAELGMDLVDATDPPDPRAEQDHVALLGREYLSDGWWVGWPADMACPLMSVHGGASPALDCDELHPYVCEAVVP